MLTIRFRDSAILDSFFPQRRQRWTDDEVRFSLNDEVEIDVDRLSFFDDPDHVLEIFSRIVEAECGASSVGLHLSLPAITDLAPLLFLSEIWADLSRVVHVGRLTNIVRKVMHGTRIAHIVGVPSISHDELGDIWAFPRDHRHDADTSTSTTRHLDVPRRDDVAPRMADKVSEWIMAITNKEACLSEAGRGLLINLVTEILDNAERHSSPTGDGAWTVSAFMVESPGEHGVRFDCHLAFLSLGSSFADSLRGAGGRSRRLVDEYLANQRKAAGGAPRQSDDTLLTLLALQDWITGDPKAEPDKRGGLGLMHVLGFVNELGGGCDQGDEPQLVIVSGNSCVKCCVPYVTPNRGPNTRRRTMWFNDGNEPTIAPDPIFVHDLRRRFPGSVISVKFTMNDAHLKKLAEDGNNDA